MEPHQGPHHIVRFGARVTPVLFSPPEKTPSMPSSSPEERKERFLAFLRVADFSNERACYDELVRFLHPDGLRCNRCGAKDGLRVHRRSRDPVLSYICASCFCVFNAWTGTVIQGLHRRPSEILAILSRVITGMPTARIARELGCHRRGVLSLRRRFGIATSWEIRGNLELRTRPPRGRRGYPGESDAED
jgi:transposase-like protein